MPYEAMTSASGRSRLSASVSTRFAALVGRSMIRPPIRSRCPYPGHTPRPTDGAHREVGVLARCGRWDRLFLRNGERQLFEVARVGRSQPVLGFAGDDLQ